MRKEKTVYVLGAGFSMNAGAPSQAKLISEMLRLHRENPGSFAEGKVRQFQKFLRETLYIQDDLHEAIPLEDVYTPIDRCLLDDINFRNLTIPQILQVRSNLNYLIAQTLDLLLKKTSKDYIDKFAAYLVEKAKVRSNHNYRDSDPVSVISMNWDILLDNSLKEALKPYVNLEHDKLAVVDYCCYISSFKKDDHTIKPGLEALGRGGFNVKLLKLHGSLNWLSCPRCKSLYIGFDEKIGLLEHYNQQSCRHCLDNYPDTETYLLSNLIMPTFLKNLSSPQLKLIWQNAGVEFAEASRIVFIGYSLPQADFEIRQLMSRMIRKDAVIEVVDPTGESESRYKTFFGSRKPLLHKMTAEDFVSIEIEK